MSQLEDVSQVQKYEMSDEAYQNRDDTFRKYKEEMRKKDPNFMKSTKKKIPEDFQKEEADLISVGSRCEVVLGARRGEVKFVGKVAELGAGFWIGIQLDEPTGDTDGSAKGVQYFEAQGGNKYGCFVRPKDMKVGDYPPANDFDENVDEI